MADIFVGKAVLDRKRGLMCFIGRREETGVELVASIPVNTGEKPQANAWSITEADGIITGFPSILVLDQRFDGGWHSPYQWSVPYAECTDGNDLSLLMRINDREQKSWTLMV